MSNGTEIQVFRGLGSVNDIVSTTLESLKEGKVGDDVFHYTSEDGKLSLDVDWGGGVYIVRKSPVIEKHGLADPEKFPGTCDVTTVGEYNCYVLPNEYKKGEYKGGTGK